MRDDITPNLSEQPSNHSDILLKTLERVSELEVSLKDNLPEDKKKSEEDKAAIEAQVVEELNKTIAIVHTNTTHILIEKSTDNFVLDSKSSLLTLYENKTVRIGNNNFSKAQIWLKSPQRRTFDDIVFNPKVIGHYDGKYNLWKGYAVGPVQGNCSLFWEHLETIVCNRNHIHYVYIRKLLAHLFQKPWIIGIALVLRGRQGTGKGAFINAIGRLLGLHFAHLASLDRILGRFNAHLKNAILIYADEAVWSGKKKEIGILKTIITEPKFFIEAKGKDGCWIDNYKHLFVSSNENWVVPIDPDDRRFFVLDVSSEKKEDFEYFNAFYRQLNKGGYEALLYDLLHEDLTGFDPQIMPENYSGFDMKLQTASSFDRFLYASLKEGQWDHAHSISKFEFREIGSLDFFTCYRSWCLFENQTLESHEIIGKRLREIFLNFKTTRPAINTKRKTQYVFPSIDECRRCFEIFYKQNSSIWEWSGVLG